MTKIFFSDVKLAEALKLCGECPEFELARTLKDAQIQVTNIEPSGGTLAIIVWDKHDVEKIDPWSDNPNVRGFFLNSEVKRDPKQILDLLAQLCREVTEAEERRGCASRARTGAMPIGSMVKQNQRDLQELASSISRKKMMSLFFDPAILKTMTRLRAIIRDLSPRIDRLRKDPFGKLIKQIIDKDYLTEEHLFDGSDKGTLAMLGGQREKAVQIEPILITGDTGVGKTLVARWIHHQGKFPGEFREINASGLSAELLEIELFGYCRGTHSQATRDMAGLALQSVGGVLFLDEIGDLDKKVQPKILKFIEDQAFRPLGWLGGDIYAPQLIVAATNKNLENEEENDGFRNDLLARFKHRVRIPSLDERRTAIPALADFLLQNPDLRGRGSDAIKFVAAEALEKLQRLQYPDNFRGLERTLMEAANRTREWSLDIILPEAIQGSS